MVVNSQSTTVDLSPLLVQFPHTDRLKWLDVKNPANGKLLNLSTCTYSSILHACTVSWFAKKEIYVLPDQPIFSFQANKMSCIRQTLNLLVCAGSTQHKYQTKLHHWFKSYKVTKLPFPNYQVTKLPSNQVTKLSSLNPSFPGRPANRRRPKKNCMK